MPPAAAAVRRVAAHYKGGHRETKQSMQKGKSAQCPLSLASPSRLPYRGSHNRSVVYSATLKLHISFSSSQHNRMASAGYKKIGCRVFLGSRLVLFLLFTSSSARAGGLRAGRATTPCSHSEQVYRRAQQDAPEQSSKWRGCRCSRAGRISPARSTRER